MLYYIVLNDYNRKYILFIKNTNIDIYTPNCKKKYEEEIDSPYVRSFLETPYLSDQAKIKTIGYFNKKSAEKLYRGISATKKVDNLYDRFSSSVKKMPESTSQYDLYLTNSGGNFSKNRHFKKLENIKK
jgi:hypothetical protein